MQKARKRKRENADEGPHGPHPTPATSLKRVSDTEPGHGEGKASRLASRFKDDTYQANCLGKHDKCPCQI